MIANRDAQMHETTLARKRANIIRMAQQNPKRRDELAERYVKLSNKPEIAWQEFANKMKEYEDQQLISQRDKTLLKGGLGAQRRLEYDRK